MVRISGGGFAVAAAAPGPEAPVVRDSGEQLRNSYNSAEAVSFGFVATAILISMFVAMAIFERFIRPRRSTPQEQEDDRSPDETNVTKLEQEQSPHKAETYPWGVSVLMPGEAFPTHIAQPSPAPP